MKAPNGEQERGVIRITRQEALSPHVDHLLQRQRSLRGQPGTRVESKGPWYRRNWLVLSVAGLTGALAAWALIEPVFDDLLYVQGPIEQVELEARSERLPGEGQSFELQGWLRLRGTTIWVPVGAKAIGPDGARSPLDLNDLRLGEEVGLYGQYAETPQKAVGVAQFVVRSPPPAEPSAQRTMESLSRRSQIAGLLLFPLVAGFVGLAIGAADGLVCRLPRRALLAGGVGLLVGLLGGFLSSLVANVVYMPLNLLAVRWMTGGPLSALGFLVQVIGRTLAWALAGMAMGLGQGAALRSKRLLLFGFLGGVVGGLLGGLLFDPIDLILLGTDKPSAHWSRLVGFGVIGASVGAMIGVVELLARDAWLRMTEGPLSGKEFLIFRDVLKIGSSSQSDIYLFSDPLVASHHATLRVVGDEYELENQSPRQPALVNGRAIQRSRLNHGDQITIGRTCFVFQRRRS